MIGLPPVAGFISKWYLGAGAVAAGMPWVIGILVASTLLNAAYFLPVIQRIWLHPPPARWPAEAQVSRLESLAWSARRWLRPWRWRSASVRRASAEPAELGHGHRLGVLPMSP
jgi:NADH:ubiquinone oxidoreductase subunit 5 (subunit L)/multisubunit Na+/H+ antiporter MnhA subunit